MLVYNLIRTIMVQSCCRAGMLPREISFKPTAQTLEAFQPLIATQSYQCLTDRLVLHEQITDAIAAHQVGYWPVRIKLRLRKRRFKKYDSMMKPREEAKLKMLKRLIRK